ncbi:MAG TPA: hypothetical protein DIS62_07305 [Candidatus Kerfeldbacteria bacterium]|nr:MAG: hypothetical protein UY34_C0010G0074 [Parcubacteria group bacterium GW2011_GWA2_48_9]KKW16535.1 MAG: hypothetical protein UY52_C0003G0031 [Parcubacteria group bacterium GW2011_GWC2_49_9]HCM68761.1 hypothetical protein [Candidatus Kerfeldbacteria bacterium]
MVEGIDPATLSQQPEISDTKPDTTRDSKSVQVELERIEREEIPHVMQIVEQLRYVLGLALEIERVTEAGQEHGKIILGKQYEEGVARVATIVESRPSANGSESDILHNLHTYRDKHGTPELHLQDIRNCQARLSTLRSRAETLRQQVGGN